ncbi:hypothetical protein BT67DRAFT_268204 [Trichocladium antarcticum]|uniref:Uncharacterized protein n=1 Tax=Trichocladium antarcticum TaxID=1450529 RepID=A0AAN6ZF58_9PEZI|nr:hypothetical protein BT67DRAFT_268204 [Trichocladium antarcticum]
MKMTLQIAFFLPRCRASHLRDMRSKGPVDIHQHNPPSKERHIGVELTTPQAHPPTVLRDPNWFYLEVMPYFHSCSQFGFISSVLVWLPRTDGSGISSMLPS